ncbi:MAG: radical SAM family heme chaperone HemW, partial [Candidatus Izimaplasma sp.]|nr:radical SAM family heme chaperone HemW [Candidatus Izimaplasma bacterium]
ELFSKYNINRVSIGVQTFNEAHLKFLGRIHLKKDVTIAIDNLLSCGIDNINVDMIFSLVNQTLEELYEDIKQVTILPIKHISYYSLILEEKTKLHYLYRHNKISMNDEDIEALMYNKVIDKLIEAGFNQYEISNYSKKGYESLHNLVYWHNEQYLGLGSGSHSLYKGIRFSNISNVTKYSKDLVENGYSTKETYDVEPLREELIMGLRLISGININIINSKYNVNLFDLYPEINDFIDKKLLVLEDNQLYFTRKGLMLGNIVFSIF